MIGSFLAALISYVAGGVLKKETLRRYGSGPARFQLFNALSSFAAVLFLLAMGLPKSISTFTVVLGILFGLVVAGQNLASLQALELGPLSYTMVICSLSTLIPTLSGALIWGETVSPVQYVGIGALVVCFILSSAEEGESKKGSLKWLVWCLVAFLCAGAIGVIQKWHQNTPWKDQQEAFLLVALSVSALFSTGALAICVLRKKAEPEARGYLALLPLLIMTVFGFCVALNNKLNLYLAGVMDSAVLYPVMNGGTLMGTTLCACLIFRERLTKRQWIGLAVGIVAVILLCDPFG